VDYSTLIKQIAIRTWQDEDSIRRTLKTFGKMLPKLKDGELLITPFGTFRGHFRHKKRVRLPNGTWTEAGPQMQVKFRPGKRCRRDLTET
jgi:nucleoid DNA-binding protein